MTRPDVLPVFLLLMLAIIAPCSGLQDADRLMDALNGQLIPVDGIVYSGNTVAVRYGMEGTVGPAEFGQDILYIMGASAREFPSSSTIRVDCFVGDTPVRYYEVSTEDVRDYAMGLLGDAEIRFRVNPKTPGAAMTARIKSSYSPSSDSSMGLFQAKGVLLRAWEEGRNTIVLIGGMGILVVLAGAGLFGLREFRRGN